MKKLYHGAEAIIYKKNNSVIKDRIPKKYRHPSLDKKIRRLRTRHEARIIEKVNKIIPSPKIISADENNSKIEISFINGKRLSDNLEKLDYKKIAKQIGKNLAKLHGNDIIHGDLTTSNLIYSSNILSASKTGRQFSDKEDVCFIDFGLSYHSPRIEDKAVDLHLIKEALTAKHPKIAEQSFKEILKGYQASKNYKKTLAQLEKVEKRGRYKAQY